MRTNRIYFRQTCAVCGRGMRVQIELLGREVRCAHCGATQSATDGGQTAWTDLSIDERIENLERQDQQLAVRQA
ncbi:hypothetical protein NZK35_14715 [Stieleria sp. ICT_E10.1]|uniref:hypothetical protein n=1 Tax=Stieleria sedimenti TaxID=2976331 RepID=UPI00217FBE13|nr:hypothetical protein [Stieleria sedimenti]MCS7467903.1 hypothetical protein [Stieleria sedimenti]